MIDLQAFIRDVRDFPTKGIVFKDITPLWSDPAAMQETVRQLAAPFEGKGIQRVVGIESRGFVFGALLAERFGASFVPIRKKGKLPYRTIHKKYTLEYGEAAIEMHADAVAPGDKVLMVDDLLATGGTMAAACDLVRQLRAEIVGLAFVVELDYCKGRQKLPGQPVHSLIHYASE